MVLTKDDKDRERARAQAATAFDNVANRSNQILPPETIAASDFSKLWGKLNEGLPYCEEQHVRTLNTISQRVKVVHRRAFLDCFPPWYQEKAKLEEKFNEIAEGCNHILTTDLPNLLGKILEKNSWCEEKTDNISEEVKVIFREVFLEWYVWYMFA